MLMESKLKHLANQASFYRPINEKMKNNRFKLNQKCILIKKQENLLKLINYFMGLKQKKK